MVLILLFDLLLSLHFNLMLFLEYCEHIVIFISTFSLLRLFQQRAGLDLSHILIQKCFLVIFWIWLALIGWKYAHRSA